MNNFSSSDPVLNSIDRHLDDHAAEAAEAAHHAAIEDAYEDDAQVAHLEANAERLDAEREVYFDLQKAQKLTRMLLILHSEKNSAALRSELDKLSYPALNQLRNIIDRALASAV